MNTENQFPHDYDIDNLVKADLNGFFLFVTKRYRYHYIENKYEDFSTDIFLNLLKEDSVVVDVGANYGYYTMLAATKNRNGKVYSFEPVKENFNILNKNVVGNGFINIETHNLAISNASGEAIFNVTEASDSAGFYEHPNTKTFEKRTVKTVSLDEFFTEKKVDIIKIDTEGHESYVLDGMTQLIKKNPKLKLLIEFNPKCLHMAGTDPTDLLSRLSGFGFDIFFLNEKKRNLRRLGDDFTSWNIVMDGDEYANILCIQKEESLFVSFLSHSAMKCGAELSLLSLVTGLTKRGMLCHVFLPEEGPLYEELRLLPVSVDIIPLPRWTIATGENRKELSRAISLSSMNLAQKLSFYKPDILYTNTQVICQGAIASRILGIKHVWHFHEFGEKDHNFSFFLDFISRKRYMLRHSDVAIFNSVTLQKYFGDGNVPRNSYVAYNVVDFLGRGETSHTLGCFKNRESLKILLVGQIHIGKGQMDALMAVKNVLEKKPGSVELHIVGQTIDELYYQSLLKYIKDEELELSVFFDGFIENPSAFFHQTDIVLVCSESEAFGRVTAEGMLCGKLIIGKNTGATPELIEDGKTGLLYSDYKDLSVKIISILEDENRFSEIGHAAAQKAKDQFTDQNYSGKIFSLLNALKLKKSEESEWNFASHVLGNFSGDYKSELDILRSRLLEKEGEVQKITTSLRWKIPNYFYKTYKKKVKPFIPRRVYHIIKPVFGFLNQLRNR